MRVAYFRTAALAVLVALTGCAATQEVMLAKSEPVTSIRTVAQVPDAGNSPEMDEALGTALRVQGLVVKPALQAGARTSPDVDAIVSYVDNWRWDIVMFLKQIDIQMYDARSGDLLVTGTWTDAHMHGYNDPLAVIQGLLSEMLAKLRGEASASTPVAGTTAAAPATVTASATPSAPPLPRTNAPYVPGDSNRWVSIGSAAELRAVYSGKTHRGRVYGRNTATGTPYVAHYRTDGSSTVEWQGRSYQRRWEIRGSNMLCGQGSGATSDCYRIQRNAVNPNEFRGRHVSRDLAVQFTVD